MTKIPRTVILLGIVSLINDASSDMIMPLLPVFISNIGGGGLAVGAVGSIGDAVASFLKAFSGYISDRFESRKPLVIGGYGLSVISKSTYFLAQSWPAVLVLRIVDRVGKGIRTSPRDALVAAVTPEKIRGRAFGLQRALDTAGAILGSALAFVFLYFLDLDVRTILMIGGPLSLLTMIPLSQVKEAKGKAVKVSSSFIEELDHLPREFKLSMIPVALFYLGNFTYMFFVLRTVSVLPLEKSLAFTIALYFWFNLFYAAASYPMGALSDRWGRKKLITLGYFLFALTSLGFAYASSLPALVFLFALYGLFNATIEGNEKAFAVDLAGRAKGTAVGAFYATEGLMMLPSGLIAGFLWDAVSQQAAFLYGAVMAVLAMAALHFLVKD